MITYKGYFNRDYKIIGWLGTSLKTETGGKTFILSREDTIMLLAELGLQEQDIPGHSVPPKKWRDLDGSA